jgi:glucosamine--fructose-6-phosphate aminotransferase (isomerizing)
MQVAKGGLVLQEILEQTDGWKEVIKAYNQHRETLVYVKKFGFNQIIFVGTGVSYFAALYASHLFRDIAKLPSLAFPSSEIIASETLPFDKRLKTMVVAISRTGETDDTLWAIQHIKAQKPDVQVMAISNNPKGTLLGLGDKAVALPGTSDDNVFPIRSFSSQIYLLSLMAGALGGSKNFLGELSNIPKSVNIKAFQDQIFRLRRLMETKHINVGGTGIYYPLAGYGALIAKMMSLTPSYAYQALEFRHNQFASCYADHLYVGILSDRLIEEELDAMRDAAKMKSMIFLLSETVDEKIEVGVEFSLKFESGLSPYARAFHVIACLQLIALQHTIMKSLNPDKPKHLTNGVRYKQVPPFITNPAPPA